MTAEAEVKRQEVSVKSRQAEELMEKIKKDEKNANEQKKIIEHETEKIEKEKEDSEKLAEEAEYELNKALPALNAANQAILELDKKSINEIKSYASPPADVATVMSAVMVILGKPTTWLEVKRELADIKFIDKIMYIDKDNMKESTIKAVEQYTKRDNFYPEHIKGISLAAGALCLWVRSLESYAKALKIVKPKRAAKERAEEQLAKKVAYLNELQEKYRVLEENLKELKDTLQKTTEELENYRKELEDLQIKIERGEKMVSGLQNEKIRWEAQLINYDD